MRSSRTSGIYSITSPSGKVYIGSSVNIESRWYDHRHALARRTHHCVALQRAVNKYGLENFVFEILEECAPDMLLEAEQQYIDMFVDVERSYNSSPIAGSRLGVAQSDETREKLSTIVADQWAKRQTLADRQRKTRSDNRTGCTGVSFNKASNRWWARATLNGRVVFIGAFGTFDEAKAARVAYVDNPEAGDSEIDARKGKPISSNTSGFTGVTAQTKRGRKTGRWVAQPVLNGKQTYLGSFATPEEANAAIRVAKAEIAPREDEQMAA